MPGPKLLKIVEKQATSVPVGPELSALGAELRKRYGDSVAAILFYGSCMRSGNLLEGLADLYVVVDGYRGAYQSPGTAFVNWLLPPNVFYLEIPVAAGTVRAKYAVLSMKQLLKGTSGAWFQTYLWGRFAQPTAILYTRDDRAEKQVITALGQAIVTFLSRSLPRLPERFTARQLWESSLELSYGTELRAEKSNRKVHLFDTYQDYYQQLTPVALTEVPCPIQFPSRSPQSEYAAQIPGRVRQLTRVGWALRKVQGKLLSLLRLAKALFTFRGGVDYILWKLERHSGVKIDAPERVRRHPLLFGWGLVWRLYRRGVFR
jgi:hypothetical protein